MSQTDKWPQISIKLQTNWPTDQQSNTDRHTDTDLFPGELGEGSGQAEDVGQELANSVRDDSSQGGPHAAHHHVPAEHHVEGEELEQQLTPAHTEASQPCTSSLCTPLFCFSSQFSLHHCLVSAASSLRTPVLFQQPVLSAPLSCFSSHFSPQPSLVSAASSLSTLSCFSSQFSLHPCLVSAASSLRTPLLFQQPVLSASLFCFSSQFSPHPSLVSAASRVLVFLCTLVLFQQPVLSAPLSCFSSQFSLHPCLVSAASSLCTPLLFSSQFSLHPSLVQQPVLSAPLCTPLLFQQPVLSAPLCAPCLVSAATQVSV